VLLEAHHLLFSLASPASQLVPKPRREALVRARDKCLQEHAAQISYQLWLQARPAADMDISNEKLKAAKVEAMVRPVPFSTMLPSSCVAVQENANSRGLENNSRVIAIFMIMLKI
jgi:hypothetical protein